MYKGRCVKRKTHLLVNSTIKHQLNSNSSRNTHSLGHGRVPTRHTELTEGTGTGLLLAVLVLDAELVLQHDHVALLGGVLHLLLEGGAEGVERVSARSDLLVGREKTDPAQAAEDAVAVFVVGEGGLGGDGPLQVLLVRGRSAQDLSGGFLPGDRGVEVVAGIVFQEADVHQTLDHLGEALVAEGTANDGLGFRDLVALAEGGGVTVGVADKGEAGVDEVGFGRGHQVGAGDTVDFAVLVELGGIAEGKEHATAGPGELVAQRVVGAFGGRETTAVREERVDLATFSVDLLSISINSGKPEPEISNTYLSDGLDSVQVVDTLKQIQKPPSTTFPGYQHTGSNPISFITVIPAFLHSSSNSIIAGET